MRGFDVFPVSFLSSVALLVGGTAALLDLEGKGVARLEGSVLEATRRTPLSGAEVAVESHGRMAAETRSDEGGEFAIGGLPPGYYQVSVSHAGYRAACRGIQLPAAQTRRIRAELVPIDR